MYNDRTMTCKDCGTQFTFTAGEQEFYAEKGFTNEPQRCPDCRAARKNNSRGASSNGQRVQRQMFDAVCGGCGKTCKVPFEPKNDRPVYCSECFENNRK